MNRLAETSDWLFVEKQAQVPAHVLLESLRQEYSSEYFAPIYNLEDELSGPLLVSKNLTTTEQLRNAYGSNQFTFIFHCWGKAHTACPEHWTCDLSIAWDKAKNRFYPSKDGKKSATEFTIQKHWDNFLLLECRTNYLRRQQLQIHTHFSYVDILGDTLWSKEPNYLYLEDFKRFVKNSQRKPITSGLHLHLSHVKFSLNDSPIEIYLQPPASWIRIEKFLEKYAKR